MPITPENSNDPVIRRQRGGRGRLVLLVFLLALVCGLGVGVYFLVDHLRWVGLLLVAHSVASLTVILTSLSRPSVPALKGLTFA